MSELLSKSNDFKLEYCCTIVRIGEVLPIEGSDLHENLLEQMKHDTEHFGMEQDEPLCRSKVPREGICLRIDNDPVNECFKLKTLHFLGKEAELMDKGEVDIEMQDVYK